MDQRIQSFLWGSLFVLAALYLVANLMSASTFAAIVAVMGIVVPVLMVLIIAKRSIWIGLLIGLMSLSIPVPLPLLDHFSYASLFAAMITGLVVAERSIRKSSKAVFNTIDSKFMLVIGAVVLSRLIIDRPGSSRVGSSGGAGEAFMYAIAFMSFWSSSVITSEPVDVKQNLRIIVFFVCVGVLYRVGEMALTSKDLFFRGLFENPVWLALSLSLSYMFWRQNKGLFSRFIRPLLIIVSLTLSSVSIFRSRPLYAVGIILGVAYIYRRFTRTFIFVAVFAAIGIGTLLVFHQGSLPDIIKRPLSTIVATDEDEVRHISRETASSPEVGWKSQFRAKFYLLAWEQIRRHALLGKGFAFSAEDLNLLYSLSDAEVTGKQLFGVLSGGYHNSALALTVFCGIPVGILFLVAFVSFSIRFVQYARKAENTQFHYFYAGLFGYYVARSGQMLVNGSANDMFVICTIMGMMNGFLNQRSSSKNEGRLQETS